MGEPAEQNEGAEVSSIWNKDTLRRVQEFAKLNDDVANERAELSARLAAGKQSLIAMGFNKDALKAAIKYKNTPEDKRELFDLTYMYCRRALDVPIQDDLFVAAMQQQVTVAVPKKDD